MKVFTLVFLLKSLAFRTFLIGWRQFLLCRFWLWRHFQCCWLCWLGCLIVCLFCDIFYFYIFKLDWFSSKKHEDTWTDLFLASCIVSILLLLNIKPIIASMKIFITIFQNLLIHLHSLKAISTIWNVFIVVVFHRRNWHISTCTYMTHAYYVCVTRRRRKRDNYFFHLRQ